MREKNRWLVLGNNGIRVAFATRIGAEVFKKLKEKEAEVNKEKVEYSITEAKPENFA